VLEAQSLGRLASACGLVYLSVVRIAQRERRQGPIRLRDDRRDQRAVDPAGEEQARRPVHGQPVPHGRTQGLQHIGLLGRGTGAAASGLRNLQERRPEVAVVAQHLTRRHAANACERGPRRRNHPVAQHIHDGIHIRLGRYDPRRAQRIQRAREDQALSGPRIDERAHADRIPADEERLAPPVEEGERVAALHATQSLDALALEERGEDLAVPAGRKALPLLDQRLAQPHVVVDLPIPDQQRAGGAPYRLLAFLSGGQGQPAGPERDGVIPQACGDHMPPIGAAGRHRRKGLAEGISGPALARSDRAYETAHAWIRPSSTLSAPQRRGQRPRPSLSSLAQCPMPPSRIPPLTR